MYKIPNWKLMVVEVLCITCFIPASIGNCTPTQENCETYLKCPAIVINPPQLIAGQPIPPIVIDPLNESQLLKEQPIPPIAIDPPPPQNLPGQPLPPIKVLPASGSQLPGKSIPSPSDSQPPGISIRSPYLDQTPKNPPIDAFSVTK